MHLSIKSDPLTFDKTFCRGLYFANMWMGILLSVVVTALG